MAELVIKVGSVSADPTRSQDGDILAAFNRRRIRCVHAQQICHVMLAGGGVGVARDKDHVARDWFEHTHKYKFERLSLTEIKRITLTDMSEVTVDGTPKLIDGRRQHMDVELYLRRRLAHARHKIFDVDGVLTWYGGTTDVSHGAMDLVWTAIEAKTANLEADFPLWPAGSQDLISYLFVTVDDFDEATAIELISPEMDLTGTVFSVPVEDGKRHIHHIDWKTEINSKEHLKIEDKGLSVDLRDTMTPLVRATVVKTKTATVVI